MSRLGRFLHLERPRPGGPEPGRRPAGDGGRFDAIEKGEAVGSAPATGLGSSRFEPAPTPAEEAPLRALEDDGGQPFVRCQACRHDSFATATRCQQCDADLTTPAQRLFNAALWNRLVAEKQEMAAESERLRTQIAAGESQLRASQREAMDSLLAELRRQSGGARPEPWSVGVFLLRQIRDPGLRLGVLGALGALVVGLAFWKPSAAVFAVAILLSLFGATFTGRRL